MGRIKSFFLNRLRKADLGDRRFDGKPRPSWWYFAYSALCAGAHGYIVFLVLSSRSSLSNFLNSVVFLSRSFAYYALKIFERDPAIPATAFDSFDWSVNYGPMGKTWQGVADSLKAFGCLLVNPTNALDGLAGGAQWLLNATRIIFLAALLILPLVILFRDYFKSDAELNREASLYKTEKKAQKIAKRRGRLYGVAKIGDAYKVVIARRVGDKTRALEAWERTFGIAWNWSSDFLRGFFRFVFGYWSQPDPKKNRKRVSLRPWVWKIAVLFLAYYFNLFAALLDFFAYYYLFFASFDFVVLGKWVATGFVLFWPLIVAIPGPAWLLLAYLAFDWARCLVAKKKERKEKEKNMKAAKKCGASNIKEGPPGRHKTTGGVMEARDGDEELRESCFDGIERCSYYFPYFPWMQFFRLEKDEITSKDGNLRNSAQADAWADKVFADLKIFFPRYSETLKNEDFAYFDGAAVVTMREAMENAAKAFFFLQTQHPLVCSSFPMLVECDIKEPEALITQYAHKSLKTDFAAYPEKRQFSFIADEDSWKVDRPLDKNGNAQGDLEGVQWLVDEANKIYPNKTDRTSGWRTEDGIKRSWSQWRHYTCIWSDPTIHFGVISQRSGDLPVSVTSRIESDVSVTAQSETKSFLFLWVYTRAAQELYLKFWHWFEKNFRGSRNDESLIHKALYGLYAIVARRYDKRRKQFDYFKEAIHVSYHANETVSVSGDYVRTMIVCDVYGGWFATDGQKGYVNEERLHSGHCFMDAGQWSGLYPTKRERNLRNSYEGKDVEKLVDGKGDPERPQKGEVRL